SRPRPEPPFPHERGPSGAGVPGASRTGAIHELLPRRRRVVRGNAGGDGRPAAATLPDVGLTRAESAVDGRAPRAPKRELWGKWANRARASRKLAGRRPTLWPALHRRRGGRPVAAVLEFRHTATALAPRSARAVQPAQLPPRQSRRLQQRGRSFRTAV